MLGLCVLGLLETRPLEVEIDLPQHTWKGYTVVRGKFFILLEIQNESKKFAQSPFSNALRDAWHGWLLGCISSRMRGLWAE